MLNESLFRSPTLDHLFTVDDGGPGGGSGDGGDSGDGGGSGSGDGDGGRKFTQAEMDRAASARAAEAKRTSERQISEALGVSIDEAKQIIKDRKAHDDKAKDDVTRAQEAAESAKRAAEVATAEALAERVAARVERALIKAKVKDDALDDSVALLKVEANATAEEISTAVDAFAKRRPEFFGESAGSDDGTPPPPGDPKGKPIKKGSPDDAYSKGLERAKAAGPGSTYPILESVK